MSRRPLKNVARRLERLERPSARGIGRASARRGPIIGRLLHHYKWPEWGPQQDLTEALTSTVNTRQPWRDSFNAMNSLGEKAVVMSHTLGFDVLEVSETDVTTIAQYHEDEEWSIENAPTYPNLFNDGGIIDVLYEDGAAKFEAGLKHYSVQRELPERDHYVILKKSSTGKLIYLADYQKVAILNPLTLETEEENTSSVQAWNCALAIGPSGQVIILHESGAYRLDSDTLEEDETSSTGGANWLAIYAGDGNVYANKPNNGLAQVNPNDLTIKQEWTGPQNWLEGILWGMDGFVWCCIGHYWGGEGNYHIYKVNPETFKIEADIEISQETEADSFLEFLVWTYDGYVLNAHTTDGVLYLIFVDPESATIERTIEYTTDYAVTGLTTFFGSAPTNADRFVSRYNWLDRSTWGGALWSKNRKWRSTTEVEAMTQTRWTWGSTTDLEVLTNTRWQQRSTTEISEPN